MAEFDPIVISVPKPPSRFRLPKIFKGDSARSTKIVASIATIVIGLSMVGFVGFTVLTNSKNFKQKKHISAQGQIVPEQSSGSEKSASALPGGDTIVGTSINTGTNSPVVTLSATPSSVAIGKKSHLKWSVTNNPKTCVASEDWSGNKDPAGEEDTQALTKSQNYIFTLTCKTATGTGFSTVSIGILEQVRTGDLTKSPSLTIAAKPNNPFQGYTTLLSWSVTNAPTSCTASGDWGGTKSTSGSGSETTVPLTELRKYTFTLTCSNSAGSATSSAYVTPVPPPPDVPITVMTSDTSSPALAGIKPTLTWSATNSPTSCIASGDALWSGAKNPAGGSQQIGPLNTLTTYTFVITCSNSTASTIATVTMLIVPPAPQVSLSVSATNPYVGSTATVSWSATSSPTKCTMSGDLNWVKNNTSSGTDLVSLTTVKTYLFSLSCTNAGGTGHQDNVPLYVTYPPSPQVNINVSPISITTGQSATVTWTTTNSPTSCVAGGNGWSGQQAFNSSKIFTPSSAGTYTYSLDCNNANPTHGTDSTTLTVTNSGTTVVVPVVTISFSTSSIGTGSKGTLSWSSTGPATSCTASNTAGDSLWTGNKNGAGTTSTSTLNTAGTYTYSLFCSNTAGTSATKSASITVIAVPQPSISVSPNPVNTGALTTVTWSATNNPTSCTASGSGWSGALAGAGSVQKSYATAGTYTFTVQCSNAGGTGPLSNAASVTVNAAGPVYCKYGTASGTGAKVGNPCYGNATMLSHAGVGNCWAWISDPGAVNTTASKGNWVIDITNFATHHPGGTSTGTLESPKYVCNHDIRFILEGNSNATISNVNYSIPGDTSFASTNVHYKNFTDGNGNGTHTHQNGAQNNSSVSKYQWTDKNGTTINGMIGYYDPTNPN